ITNINKQIAIKHKIDNWCKTLIAIERGGSFVSEVGLLTLCLESLNFRSSGQRAVSTVLSYDKTILKWSLHCPCSLGATRKYHR
ncbi:5218_t:CDS:2, partial [Racocetra persica]